MSCIPPLVTSFVIYFPNQMCEFLLTFVFVQVIQMRNGESDQKQIAEELKINRSAQCPYIVVCYQSFYENGTISIILEYMDGGSLADFLKKVRNVPEPYLAAICKQVFCFLFLYEYLRSSLFVLLLSEVALEKSAFRHKLLLESIKSTLRSLKTLSLIFFPVWFRITF